MKKGENGYVPVRSRFPRKSLKNCFEKQVFDRLCTERGQAKRGARSTDAAGARSSTPRVLDGFPNPTRLAGGHRRLEVRNHTGYSVTFCEFCAFLWPFPKLVVRRDVFWLRPAAAL